MLFSATSSIEKSKGIAMTKEQWESVVLELP